MSEQEYKEIVAELKYSELSQATRDALLEAVRFKRDYQAEMEKMYNQLMETEKEYIGALERKETLLNLQEVTMSILSSDRDTAIDKYNTLVKVHQEQAQRCINRMDRDKFVEIETNLSDIHLGYNSGLTRAINIIKEELEV